MRRGKAKFGAVLLIILVATIMIGGIIWLGKSVLNTDDASDKPAIEQTAGQKLLATPNDKTKVRMSVRGPIVAREKHYSIELEISGSARKLVLYQGYDQPREVKRVELGNDQKALKDLTLALNNNGYMQPAESKIELNNGLCATGQLIKFSVADGDKVAGELWTTSCAQIKGNFGGANAEIIDLLLAQIPDSRKTIREVTEAN